MRILQLHCDSIEYTPTKKEIKSAEEIEPKKTRIEEVVVCFTAVEENDDSDVAKNAIVDIQKSMKQIGCKKLGLPSIFLGQRIKLLIFVNHSRSAEGGICLTKK